MDAAKGKTILVAEVDPVELTLRIAEAACDFERPPGLSAASCLAELRARDPATTAIFDRIALAVMKYVTECLANGRRPS